MWERFNYYGMRAVLILFMTKALLFDKSFASNLYGSYTSLIYLTPLLGGYMADRYWGNKMSVISGGLAMATGELLLFGCGSLYNNAPFIAGILLYSGLGVMIAGNGFFKPNISSMVGQLYPRDSNKTDTAYIIFYMGINTGGALGPLICGWVGDTGSPADFKWAFLVAGAGMLFSVIIQLCFHHNYVRSPEKRALGVRPPNVPRKLQHPFFVVTTFLILAVAMIILLYTDAKIFSFLSYLLLTIALFIIVTLYLDSSLTTIEKQRISVIFIIVFFVIFFWSAFEQAGASLTFFADEQTNRQTRWFTIPASFFLSLGSIFIVFFAPLFAWTWSKMGQRAPSAPVKMACGLLFLALGYLWIAQGVTHIRPGIKVSMIWLIGLYLLHTFGELCLSPIGLSLVNRLAPFKFASLLMAVWFMANAAANKLAGVLSTLYPDKGKTTHFLGFTIQNMHDFFILFVYMSAVSAVLLFMISRPLQKLMNLPSSPAGSYQKNSPNQTEGQ
jgi:POT family proton-dependent oligopeptide transporter